MAQLFSNNAFSHLANSVSAAATGFNLVVGTGVKFPVTGENQYFYATLVGLNVNGQESAWEIVKVCCAAGDTFTVERGQEGTTALAWGSGTRIEMRVTARTLTDLVTIQTLNNAGVVSGGVETVLDYPAAGGDVQLDAQLGEVSLFYLHPTSHITSVTVINPPTGSNLAYSCTIVVESDGVSTVAFGAQFNFQGGGTPPMSTTAGNKDYIVAVSLKPADGFYFDAAEGMLDV